MAKWSKNKCAVFSFYTISLLYVSIQSAQDLHPVNAVIPSVLSTSDTFRCDQLLKVPLLSGVMSAGSQEDASSCGVDPSRAARRAASFFHSLQTQLGVLVNQLTAQLKQKPDSREVTKHSP